MHDSLQLDDLFSSLTQKQIFMLGRLSAAYSNFKFAEVKALAARGAAEKVPNGPGLESIAQFYDDMKLEASTALDERVSVKIESERFYRRCRHECLEAGVPDDIVKGYLQFFKENN